MTEPEWLACAYPEAMLNFLQGKASDRKLRLFAVACCRRIWHLLADERSRKAVEVAERYADGEASDDELNAATAAGAVGCYSLGRPAAAAEAASEATWGEDEYGGIYHASLLTYNVSFAVGEAPSERVAQCRLLRDVFGNPFRPTSLGPAYLTPTVTSLATAAYEEQVTPSGELDSTRRAVLADALEEVGCADDALLAHLRGPGPHVRGCWPLDIILAKE